MAWFDSNKKSGGPWEWDDVYASNAHIGLMKRKGYVLLTPEEVKAHEKNEYVPQMLTKIDEINIEAVYSTKKPKIRNANPPDRMAKVKEETTEEPATEIIEPDKPDPKPEKMQLVRRTKDYKDQIELVKNGGRTLKDVQKEYKLSPAAIKEFKAL